MLLLLIVALIVAFVFMQSSTFATTIYLHRAMAHKGLRLNAALALGARIELWLFTGIVVREWVAVHRKHHHFTDEEGDPHSPYLKGLWNVLLWNAIYYAREANKPEVLEKYTRDIPRRRIDFLLDRGWLGLALGMAIFAGGFSLLGHGWVAPVVGVITFVVQGLAYIGMNAVINGACHAIGYKNFENTATNLRLVAWFSAGEGLHNNHHQYPASSKMSMARLRRMEFDPAWPVIWTLAKLRLAQPLALPSEA
jgi:stearoyl-CoA desaturase (delta-9 desaturase)